jgi:hypothetical protein
MSLINWISNFPSCQVAQNKGDEGLRSSHMDDLGYAPIWPEMSGDTQLIDCLGGSDYSAKSSYCLLIVAQKNQRVGKTHDHTKAKKHKCRNPTLAKCGGEAQHLEKVRIWSPLGLPNVQSSTARGKTP